MHLRTSSSNYIDIDIAARTKIVKNTGTDGIANKIDCLLLCQVFTVAILENCHGSQRTTSHRNVWQSIGTAVRVDGVEARPGDIDTAENKSGADVALVAEQIALEHGHGRSNTSFAVGGHAMQFELCADHLGGGLGIGSRSSTTAVDVLGNVVDLFAVLVAHRGTTCGSSISTKNDTALWRGEERERERERERISKQAQHMLVHQTTYKQQANRSSYIENHTANRCASLFDLGSLVALLCEKLITVEQASRVWLALNNRIRACESTTANLPTAQVEREGRRRRIERHNEYNQGVLVGDGRVERR
jgi:hypothetical protein